MRFILSAAVAAAGILGCSGSSVTGSTTNMSGGSTSGITIANFTYSPKVDTVKVGTTVTWTNNDALSHTTTSDQGLWDSKALTGPSGGGSYGGGTSGQSFSYMFSQTGSYSYHCTIHPPSAYPNFTGTIVVIP